MTESASAGAGDEKEGLQGASVRKLGGGYIHYLHFGDGFVDVHIRT